MDHIPVLFHEVLEALQVKTNKRYIDTTFGMGGHTRGIVQKGGEVLGLDVDNESLEYVRNIFKNEKHIQLVQGNFRNLSQIAFSRNFSPVSGILFDLGMSSWQLDSAKRGFSFSKNEPLDMRMDKNLTVTAKDLINVLHKGELYDLFRTLGEENLGRDIGLSVIRSRGVKELETTKELTDLVSDVYRRTYRTSSKKNPATKIFQALRIAVNDELNALKEALPQATELLESRGRLAIITFHSLEDSIVKDFMKNSKLLQVITKKPILPSEDEIETNSRARSAKLRVAEKI